MNELPSTAELEALAILLVVVMVAALSVSAFAATPKAGTITIENATKGQTYQAYRILDASASGDKVAYTTKTPALFAGSPFTVASKADKDGNYSVTVPEEKLGEVVSWLEANYQNFPKAGDPVVSDGSKIDLHVTEGYYFVTTTLSVLLALVLVFALTVPSLAVTQDEHAARQPDYSRTGSVTVNVTDAEGNPVKGGSLVVYEVAAAKYDNEDNQFVLTDAFAASAADLSGIDAEENGAPVLAAALADFASAQKVEGKTVAVSDQGVASCDGLELGLYLFVQTDAAKGYEPLRPFLVTVPMWDGEQLVYDISANPKPGTATEQAKLNPSVEKTVTVKNGKAPANSVFNFSMTPADAAAPMPENASAKAANGAITVNRTGAGKVEFGTMWFTLADVGKTYSYKITEVKGSEQHYTYDAQEYTMTVVVGEKDGQVTIDVKYTDKNGNPVNTMKFTNTYDEPAPKLPQTGQLWWPVMVLAAAGVLFVILGVGMRRKQN